MIRPLLVACAIALHSAVAVAQQAPARRTLATFTRAGFSSFWALTPSPNGRFVLQAAVTGLWMYEVATGQSWKLVDGGAWEVHWSPRGDRIAYVRAGDGNHGGYVWTLPVDGNSGRARGPAQRVTTGQGEFPSISPDGRFIAFAGLDSGWARHLSIVPASGGPEHILARFPSGFEGIFWSTDSRTIYLNGPAPQTGLSSVLRLSVDGGVPQVIRSRGEWIAGMTADRCHFVLVPAKSRVADGDRATVVDTTGREVGYVPLPVGDIVEYEGVLGDSALVWVSIRDRTALEIRPAVGGRARRLPRVGESDNAPIWSPDGRRIAFQVRDGGRTSLAVMTADGADPRVYRESDVLPDALAAMWSPDSRLVAYVDPVRLRMSLLDVAAGTVRVLLEDSIGQWRWRADGRAILWRSRSRPGAGIYEVTLDGGRRRLMDWPLPGESRNWQFVGDSSVFVRSFTAAVLRPVGTGPERRLASVPPGSMSNVPVVSQDRRWVAGLLGGVAASSATTNQIEVFSLVTGARTVLDLPFSWLVGRWPVSPPVFLRGDDALLVFGRRVGDAEATLFRVPLDGEAPSAFARVGTRRSDSNVYAASVSPDGRHVAYAVQPEGAIESLVLIDLRGAIPRSPARPPRR